MTVLTLLLATANPAKAERLRSLCEGVDAVFVTGDELGTVPEVPEEGGTHIANAVRKALAWSSVHQALAVASDGGLAIPALGPDWSSLVTRRNTGGDVGDEEHASRLLRRMHGLAGDRRNAHWIEAVAVARNGSLLGAWESSGLAGAIADDFVPDPAATPGFWVSGLWTDPVTARRLWELSEEERMHRGDPWPALGEPLRTLLSRIEG